MLVASNSKPAPPEPPKKAAVRAGKYVVQVGAFANETNARDLQQRLVRIGQEAFIEKGTLFLVRLGPFATRDQAVKARTELEANGMSAIVVTQ